MIGGYFATEPLDIGCTPLDMAGQLDYGIRRRHSTGGLVLDNELPVPSSRGRLVQGFQVGWLHTVVHKEILVGSSNSWPRVLLNLNYSIFAKRKILCQTQVHHQNKN